MPFSISSNKVVSDAHSTLKEVVVDVFLTTGQVMAIICKIKVKPFPGILSVLLSKNV